VKLWQNIEDILLEYGLWRDQVVFNYATESRKGDIQYYSYNMTEKFSDFCNSTRDSAATALGSERYQANPLKKATVMDADIASMQTSIRKIEIPESAKILDAQGAVLKEWHSRRRRKRKKSITDTDNWSVLLAGAIPIIKKFPGDAIYRGLPVVLVNGWDAETLKDTGLLKKWRDKLAKYFENPTERAAILNALGSGYWWAKVEAALARPPNASAIIPAHDRVIAINAR